MIGWCHNSRLCDCNKESHTDNRGKHTDLSLSLPYSASTRMYQDAHAPGSQAPQSQLEAISVADWQPRRMTKTSNPASLYRCQNVKCNW
jgi:hypothetical protein